MGILREDHVYSPSAKGKYVYDYPAPFVAVDGVVFGISNSCLSILLILRKNKDQPFYNHWALPGGFVDDMEESVDDAIARELQEETKIKNLFLEQLYTFGAPKRDPRRRVISIAYYALVRSSDFNPQPGSDAKEAKWFPVKELPKKLAFDHADIIDLGLKRIRGKVSYQPIGFSLLPETFSLGELQTVYELILDRPIDRRNFRKKMLGLDILEKVDAKANRLPNQSFPAQLYKFNVESYNRLVESGFSNFI